MQVKIPVNDYVEETQGNATGHQFEKNSVVRYLIKGLATIKEGNNYIRVIFELIVKKIIQNFLFLINNC